MAELPRTWRTPEGADRIEIDGKAWGSGDLARDSLGTIYLLDRYRSSVGGRIDWYWSCFDSEYNWTVGDPKYIGRDGPHPPFQKMRLVEADE